MYEGAADDDCYRILIDRLWPRGMSKEKAHLDLWIKEVAPSEELRTWFGHQPARWQEFKQKYEKELAPKQETLKKIKEIEKQKGTVTLVYSAKDTEQNNAVVLKTVLEKK